MARVHSFQSKNKHRWTLNIPVQQTLLCLSKEIKSNESTKVEEGWREGNEYANEMPPGRAGHTHLLIMEITFSPGYSYQSDNRNLTVQSGEQHRKQESGAI